MAAPHVEALEAAEAAFEHAKAALCAAAAAYAAEETRRLSARYLTRQVRYSCGMGSTLLFIERRRPLNYGYNIERENFVQSGGFNSRGFERPAFLDRLDEIEGETRITDVAAGMFTFKRGEAVEES
jgi:hypothetical protein